ncbi:hypothetical protein EK21DRAFT_51638 [Setomelanomma holmii]|uniref:Uncharacterized protein n=1 Tax=Setomelanomma holmii TaxID=210430 RepID=A0A9P4LQS0_9PLEO|nr:hypothetical protein EK21DRAFT_51638 [Setomelanomma holmii]
MSFEHKHSATGSVLLSPPDSTIPTRIAAKRPASEDRSEDSHSPTPTKRVKPSAPSFPTAPRISHRRLKPSEQLTMSTVSASSRNISTLMPRGGRKTAKVGQKDESLLRMLCDDISTSEVRELHFRNLPHSTIDWHNVEHINKINNWRNQIYGRAGMKSRAVSMWLPDEELWFELYYQLSIAESRARGILLPKTSNVLAAFNQTFASRILQDHQERDTEPRGERHLNAFTSKFNRMCPDLRVRLQQCVFGKFGDAFVPTITFEMMQVYKRMKEEMQLRGTVSESGYCEDLEEWRDLFSHLPDAKDVEMRVEPLPTEEDSAAAALLCMATHSVSS